MELSYSEMLERARAGLRPQVYDKYFSAGFVCAVIEGGNGKYYTGVNLDLACGLGFCAERNAASTMLTDGERVVRRVVCVDEDGNPMTPCGSCREFLYQLSPENAETEFLVSEHPMRVLRLKELLALPWQKRPREQE